MKEKFWTIPNVLSLYRLLVFPLILFWIFTGREKWMSVFIAISLVTDFLDGFIARQFNQKTEIGARLDSWADTGTFICAFLAIYLFKWDIIRPHAVMLVIFFVLWLLSYAVVFLRFRGLIGLHTYLFKTTGYLQGAFLLLLFTAGFYPVLYYIALVTGSIACIEEIIIILLLREPATNVKGLYWVLQTRRR